MKLAESGIWASFYPDSASFIQATKKILTGKLAGIIRSFYQYSDNLLGANNNLKLAYMSKIKNQYQEICRQLSETAQACQRSPDAIKILAISKTRSVEEILQAYEAGCHCFGESYIKEAIPKISALEQKHLEWHFVGPIQSNKTQYIAKYFQWVHSVDRKKAAKRINDQRPANLPLINVCIQVNVSGEASKSGVSLHELAALADYITTLPRLKLRGLMALPQKTSDNKEQRQAFHGLYQAMEELNLKGLALDTLSMGMSNDWPAAVMEGATIIRIGTGLFGPRNL